MNLLVCEFITGGGLLGQELPAGLAAEGELMLQTLLYDLARCEGVQLSCTRDARLPALPVSITSQTLSGTDSLPTWLAESVHAYDAIWLIAPETDALLYRLVSLIEQQGVDSTGCSAAAIWICTDKRRTAERLAEAGISVVPGIESVDSVTDDGQGWVLKPVDGAGSEQTFLCKTRHALCDRLKTLNPQRFLIQPYISGQVASMSLFCADGKVYLLAVNQQDVVIEDDRLKLRAIRVNGLVSEYQRCLVLAEAINGAISGLKGYVGVDFILTEAGPVVLEINPRLTSSYAGLAQSTGLNLAALSLNPDSVAAIHLDHRLARDEVVIHL